MMHLDGSEQQRQHRTAASGHYRRIKLALLAQRDSIHTVRWANGLAERGHDVHLISARSVQDPLARGVAFHLLPFPDPAGYVLNAPPLRRVLRTIRPDLLHVHYASGYGTLGMLGGYHPTVLSVWGSDVYDFPERSRLHRWLVRRNLASADWVCSTSKAMAERTRQLCKGIERLSTVPFGIDTSVFAPQPRGGSTTITVGTVKTLKSRYGVDLLIHAFAQMRHHLFAGEPALADRLRLLIVGEGPDQAYLEAQAERLGVRAVTTFAGRVAHAEVASYLNRLDIYLALSRSESFGVAVLEASACGLPVVVSDVGGLPEVVRDGVTGLIVRRENAAAAAEALLTLVRDPALRKSFGQAGRRFVEEHYSWAECTRMMERVYAQVLTESRGSRS